MKLRSHLVLLVVGALVPVLAFAAVVAVVFWRQQREIFDERLLERVRALSIALDRELEGHIRGLEVLGRSLPLQAPDLRRFYDQAQAVRAEQPAWDALIVVDESGAQVLNTRVAFGTPLPKPAFGDAVIRGVIASN